ncbi:unnamed protein product [Ectocarpus sp. 12 AP-2014]
MSQSKRKAWDATVQASGHVPTRTKTKRASGRTVVLSKSMRVVDEETRNQVKDARLEALEADNYTEDHGGEQDDEFALDEDDERGDRPRGRSRAGKAPGNKSKNKGEKDPWKERKFKSLHQVLYELTNELSAYPGGATALSIEAPVSKHPPRAFCSVCGYHGLYTCTRCGSRFCSSKCCEQHKETRCLKFAS